MKHFIRIRHTARPLLGWLCGLAALNAIRRTRTSTYSGPMWMRLPNWHCWRLSDVSVSGIPHGTVSVSGPWRLGEGWEKEPPALWRQGEAGGTDPARRAPGPLAPGGEGRPWPFGAWEAGGLRGEPLAPGPLALGKGRHPGPFGAWERGGATLPATLQKLKGCMFSSFKNLKGCR